MLKSYVLGTSLACALLTSACTTFEPLRPDMEARPLPSRADEIAYINELRTAYRVDDGQSVPCYTGENLKAFRPKYVQGYPDWDQAQEAAGYKGQCLRFAEDPGDDKMSSYLESGFGLTDLYCQRYFVVATETRQSRKLQRGIAKTGDTLMNAVLGALSVAASPIAISSAGFSAIDSGYGAIDDAFVVAPTREDVRQLVMGAQQRFRADVFSKDKDGKSQLPKRYASGRATIERYAGLCTFDGMRQLVADAVTTKTTDLNASAAAKKDQKGGGGTDVGQTESLVTVPAKGELAAKVEAGAVPPPIAPQ